MGGGALEPHPVASAVDLDKRIAIVAGGGKIPLVLAQYLKDNHVSPYIFRLNGDADSSLSSYDHEVISTAEIGKLLSKLRELSITQLVMVGTVKSRPNWRDLRLDWPTLKFARNFVTALRAGDNAILSQVVNTIETEGILVLGAHEILPSLLVPEGTLTTAKATKAQQSAISLGVKAALMLGDLDAGQACVVVGKRIVALEGAEGTDNMLRRVAVLRSDGMLSKRKGGVLVKMCKPQQDKRTDLPTIGLSTVELASAANLAGIAVHAGNALIVDFEEVCRTADAAGIFVIGVNADV